MQLNHQLVSLRFTVTHLEWLDTAPLISDVIEGRPWCKGRVDGQKKQRKEGDTQDEF